MAQEESVDCNVVNLNKISISEFIQKHKKELSNNIKFSLLSTQMLDLPETYFNVYYHIMINMSVFTEMMMKIFINGKMNF